MRVWQNSVLYYIKLDGVIIAQKIEKIIKEDRCVRFSRQNKFM